MTSDLVKKLRSPAIVFYEYAADDGAVFNEAADRIEALEKAIVDYVATVVHEEVGVNFICWMEEGESKTIVDQLWDAHEEEEARR